MALIDVKTAWEIERHDGWGSEKNTRFANLVVPYEGNERLHHMAKVFHSGFSYGEEYGEEKYDENEKKLRDYVNDQERERIREKDRADKLYGYVLILQDMLISSLPYITDSYDDETISEAGKNHAMKLEKRIREHLTTASTNTEVCNDT